MYNLQYTLLLNKNNDCASDINHKTDFFLKK